jgi:hypothetical protein
MLLCTEKIAFDKFQNDWGSTRLIAAANMVLPPRQLLQLKSFFNFMPRRQYRPVVGNAMKLPITILLVLTIAGCQAQNKEQAKEDAFNISHGVVVDKIDSNLLKDIRIVHFDSSNGLIFPGEYGKQKFGKNMGWERRTFFTIDTSLIKQIDTAIINQYCTAMRRFDDEVWNRTIESLKDDNDKKSLSRAKQQMALSKKRFQMNCPEWQEELKYYDKQYIGYSTEDGERIIYIQLLDFRQDPYNLKPLFSFSWIDGWHGWFETNTRRLHFHVATNLLTINEDL